MIFDWHRQESHLQTQRETSGNRQQRIAPGGRRRLFAPTPALMRFRGFCTRLDASPAQFFAGVKASMVAAIAPPTRVRRERAPLGPDRKRRLSTDAPCARDMGRRTGSRYGAGAALPVDPNQVTRGSAIRRPSKSAIHEPAAEAREGRSGVPIRARGCRPGSIGIRSNRRLTRATKGYRCLHANGPPCG